MSEIAEIWDKHILPHWPFLCWMTIAMFVGQVAVRNVFTKERAVLSAAWAWGRRTLAIHPIIAGAVVGLLWRDPEGGGMSLAGSVGYFATAGALSWVLFAVASRFAKARGVEIQLPGSDEEPKP